ncbi:MAG TPA: phosphoribosylglycinamide formyltransferase [Candidatus Omnitrophica bacterium]|nr:phosphoribosylglycinamide formyltransferase [Candidatus Omnitrophota bacterium]
MNIAVFASGRGTNLSAIIRAQKTGKLNVNISLMITDNPKAPAISKAKRAGVKTVVIKRKDFADKTGFEREIIKNLKAANIDLIVLAGFMRILGPDLINGFHNKIINIHPALLPSFKGAHAIADAFDYGVKITGVTVHFVDSQIDCGPIILQKEIEIKETETPQSLEKKIHKTEHKIYPEAINLILQGRVKIEGRKVKITSLS